MKLTADKLKEFGYTKENLYTRENRMLKIVKRVSEQSLNFPKYGYYESDDKNIKVYITKQLALEMPENISMEITYDDIRSVFNENEQKILTSHGPGYDDSHIPHILFESEMYTNIKKK